MHYMQKKQSLIVRVLLMIAVAIFLSLLVACMQPDDTPNGGKGNVPIDELPDYYYARGEGKEFVPTGHYPADDLIICVKNVMDYGAKADGVTDDTNAFQKALTAASVGGGGTVYVPEGKYYISRQLRIPDTVVLCGDWISPEEAPVGTKGSILITDYKSRTPQAQYGFMMLGSSSGLRNVTIYHKNQSVDKPVRMAPTVWSATQSQPSVENVTFVNSYTAVSFGEDKGTNCSLAGLVNVYITALTRGVVLGNSYDVSRLENVHISPEYWADNVIEPLSDAQKETLYDYTFEHCTGITLYRGDATGLYDTYLESCSIGILLTEDTNGNGVTSGAITLTEIQNCDIGVMVEGAHFIGTALTGFTATADRTCQVAIKTGDAYTYNTKVEDGSIMGKYTNAAILGDKATVTFTNMKFDLDTDAYVFSAPAGVISCVACEFENDKVFSDVKGQSAAYFFDCAFGKEMQNNITDNSFVHRDDTKVETQSIRQYHIYKQVLPTPTTSKIVSITEYGAKDDGRTDCTEAIQSALDVMAAEGGGIVLIPAGRYAVYGCLTVPSGVELAGVLGVWCYSGASLDSSCLLLYAGENDPDGQAAISLEQGSGIRGFLAWYPEQNYDSFVEYSYAVRSLGTNTYAINVNICNAYQYMDFGTHRSDGHYVRNCAGIAIKTGMYVGNNYGEGWLENVHLNQQQAYELSVHGEQGGYAPDRFTELVFGNFMKETEYFIFGYNENEHVLGAFGLGARSVFRFVEQDGGATTGTFIQCGADGCRDSFVVEQADNITIIAPGEVSLGEATPRGYLVTKESFEGTLNLYGGAGYGTPTSCMILMGGEVNISTFTFSSMNNATPILLGGECDVNMVSCVVPFGGDAVSSKTEVSYSGTIDEVGTLIYDGIYGYEQKNTLDD